ncbi:MAG: TonB-dependent receptor [Candidatus Azobacteroides sp.]|nr:TonB-dependent receptor [Candidatus Azobacteroides sp.]
MLKVKSNEKGFRFKRFARTSYAAFNSIGKRVTIGVLTSSMLLSVPTVKVVAKEITQKSDLMLQELEEVEVTASRSPVEINQAAKIVTVISRVEIAAAPVRSIEDLLQYTAGIDIKQRGRQGIQSDISIRGGTYNQTAILLNGIHFSNPQTGHYNFDIPVNLSDIERIEIIEGPATRIYGTGAFVGAINIITTIEKENQLYTEIGAGMHDYFLSEAGASLHKGDFSHQLSGSYYTSSGYIENSDFDKMNFFWQSHFSSEEADFHFQTGYNDKSYGANTFYSAAYPNQYDHTQRVFASLKANTKGKIRFTPQLFWNRHYDHYQLIKNEPTGENFHQTQVFGGKFDVNVKWKFGKTVFGGELLNEGVLSNVLGNPLKDPLKVPGQKEIYYTHKDNRTNVSYFLEHNIIWNNFSLSAGLVANYNSSLDNNLKFYPGVDISWHLLPPLKVYASVNTALRLPTFTDLYYEGKTNKGNPDLKPEESTAYEIGVKYAAPYLSAFFSGYYRKGKNMIDWVKENSEDIWETQNLTDLDTYGLETSFSFFPEKLVEQMSFIRQINIGYSYISQKKHSYHYISNYALDYLKHKFVVGLHHDIYGNISMQWNFRWQDRMGTYTKYVDLKPAYEEPYQAYGVLDAKINWQNNNWQAYLEATNIFDKAYYDVGNIPQPGFWLMGGVKYTFNY